MTVSRMRREIRKKGGQHIDHTNRRLWVKRNLYVRWSVEARLKYQFLADLISERACLLQVSGEVKVKGEYGTCLFYARVKTSTSLVVNRTFEDVRLVDLIFSLLLERYVCDGFLDVQFCDKAIRETQRKTPEKEQSLQDGPWHRRALTSWRGFSAEEEIVSHGLWRLPSPL